MSVPRRLPVSGTTTGFSCFFLPAALRLGTLPLIGAVEFMGNHHEFFTFLPLVCFERHAFFFMTDIVMPAQICFGISKPVPFHNIMAPIRTPIYA